MKTTNKLTQFTMALALFCGSLFITQSSFARTSEAQYIAACETAYPGSASYNYEISFSDNKLTCSSGGGTVLGSGLFNHTNLEIEGAVTSATSAPSESDYQTKCDAKVQSIATAFNDIDNQTAISIVPVYSSGRTYCDIRLQLINKGNGTQSDNIVAKCLCPPNSPNINSCQNLVCQNNDAAMAEAKKFAGVAEAPTTTDPAEKEIEVINQTPAEAQAAADAQAQAAERQPAATATNSGDTQADATKFLAEAKAQLESQLFGKDINSISLVDNPVNTLSGEGSEMGRCEVLLDKGKDWSHVAKVVKSNGTAGDVTELFGNSYKYYYYDLEDKVNSLSDSRANLAKAISENLNEVVNHTKQIQRCVALAFMTDKVDYDDPNAAITESHTNKKTSFDQKIVAQRVGVQTQDYPACSKAINIYNGAFIGKKGLDVGQTFQFQEASLDASIKAQDNIDDPTSGMVAQQEMVDEQKKIMDVRTVFEGAKGAALAVAFSLIPTREDLINSCRSSFPKASAPLKIMHKYVEAIVAANNNTLGFDVSYDKHAGTGPAAAATNDTSQFTLDTQDSAPVVSAPQVSPCTGGTAICRPAPVSSTQKDAEIADHELQNPKTCAQAANGQTALTMNETSCRDAVRMAMIDAGVEMAGNMLKAKLLDDQSDMIGDAINNVNKFKDENPTPTFEEFNAEICQVDPSAPECAAVDPIFDRTRSFSNNGISVGGGFGNATTGRPLGGVDLDGLGVNSADDKGGRGAGVDGIGTTIGGPSNSTAFVDAPPGAASMKKGSGGAAGGGGGGGVGAAANPGGGGGSSGGGGSRGVGGGKGGKVSFSGTGRGSLSFGGGRGSARKSSKKGGNPFSKFFKNKKGKKGKNLNYRGIASVGKKKDSLFGMISSRYMSVSGDRLIQYKQEKKE